LSGDIPIFDPKIIFDLSFDVEGFAWILKVADEFFVFAIGDDMDFVGDASAIFGVVDLFFAEELFDVIGWILAIAEPGEGCVADFQVVGVDADGCFVEESCESIVRACNTYGDVDKWEQAKDQGGIARHAVPKHKEGIPADEKEQQKYVMCSEPSP
jgi:hypothetical protein